MTSKEFSAFGKALKALLKAGLMDDVNKIVDYIADTETPSKDKEEDKK